MWDQPAQKVVRHSVISYCPLCGMAADKCGELAISDYEWKTVRVLDVGFWANVGQKEGRPWKLFKVVLFLGKEEAILFRLLQPPAELHNILCLDSPARLGETTTKLAEGDEKAETRDSG